MKTRVQPCQDSEQVIRRIYEGVNLMIAVNQCKNVCKNHSHGNKSRIYQEEGSFCRTCEYYFAKGFIRCPCCNTMVRHSTRNKKDQGLLLRI